MNRPVFPRQLWRHRPEAFALLKQYAEPGPNRPTS